MRTLPLAAAASLALLASGSFIAGGSFISGAPLLAAPEEPGAPPKPSGDLVPIEAHFRGKVTKVEMVRVPGVKAEQAQVEIVYDFSDAKQLLDFEPSCPFRAIRSIECAVKNGKLAVQGTGSWRLKAVFDGDVGASAVIVPRRPRDFGFAVSEERESEVFTLYCCYDRYFSAGDNVHIPQNMIIKFLARDPKANASGLQDWRYCGSRGQSPEIVAGMPYKVALGRTGMESRMSIEGTERWDSKGKEAGRDLSTMLVALFGYEAQFEADDLVVHGRLDAQWVARNRIDVTSWKPPAAPEPGKGPEGTTPTGPTISDADLERVRARIAAYPLDTKPQALAALLRDASLPASLRAEAAERAKAVGAKRLVPFLVDGLYAADLEARKLSVDVLKALLGKTFNYRPDGPEEGRKKAIRDLNEYMQKHPEEFV